ADVCLETHVNHGKADLERDATGFGMGCVARRGMGTGWLHFADAVRNFVSNDLALEPAGLFVHSTLGHINGGAAAPATAAGIDGIKDITFVEEVALHAVREVQVFGFSIVALQSEVYGVGVVSNINVP